MDITPVYAIYIPMSDKEYKKKSVRRIPGRYIASLSDAKEQSIYLAGKEGKTAYIIEYGEKPIIILSADTSGNLTEV